MTNLLVELQTEELPPKALRKLQKLLPKVFARAWLMRISLPTAA